MGTYERYSNFTIEKVHYYPKRPNSCEKARNKASIFTVPQKYFSEIRVINFSNTFQDGKNLPLGRPKSGKTLRKIKVLSASPDKMKMSLRANCKIPDKSMHLNLHKTVMKPLKSDAELNRQGLMKMLKKSLVVVKKRDNSKFKNL